jgi:Coenzyme PQQ synthesis protein D (PqqD)
MSQLRPLSLSTLFVRAAGFAEAEVDGEVVALSIDKGICYGLNSVGSRIWRELTVPVSLRDICGRLLCEYRVDQITCEQEVLALLEELRAEGLVEVRELSA